MILNIKAIQLPSKKIFFLILTLISIWAIFLRFYNLGYQSWWIDEGYSVVAAQATIEHGHPILESGWDYNFMLPYTYSLAASIKAFDLSHWSSRLPAVIFNLIFLSIIFQFCRRHINIRVAILASVLLAFSYWEIAWSRQARNYTMFQMFFWLTFYFFWNFIYLEFRTKREKYYSLILSVLLAVLTIYVHLLGLFIVPICILLTVVRYKRTIFKKNFDYKKIIISGIAVLLLATLFYAKIPFDIILGGLEFSALAKPNYYNFLLDNFFLTLVLCFLTFFITRNSPIKQKAYLLLLTYLVPYIILSLLFNHGASHGYLFVVLPALYISASIGLIFVYEYLVNFKLRSNAYPKLVSVLFAIGIILFLGFSKQFQIFPSKLYFLESDPSSAEQIEKSENTYDYYLYVPQPDWQRAYQYIEENRQSTDIIISPQTVFTNLYLGMKGYWLPFTFEWKGKLNSKDGYFDAPMISGLSKFKSTINEFHGYIVFDYHSIDQKIDTEIFDYAQKNLELVFFDTLNAFSIIWVYKF